MQQRDVDETVLIVGKEDTRGRYIIMCSPNLIVSQRRLRYGCRHSLTPVSLFRDETVVTQTAESAVVDANLSETGALMAQHNLSGAHVQGDDTVLCGSKKPPSGMAQTVDKERFARRCRCRLCRRIEQPKPCCRLIRCH